MRLEKAFAIALSVVKQLEPHCERIAVAGSIRRHKALVGDIEIVAIPKPYDVGLFASGIATVEDRWKKVKGELPCKYTQRMLPEGIALDLFFARPENWGLILAIRTGSAEYSHQVLAHNWAQRGYKSIEGMLHNRHGDPIHTPEERDVFSVCGVPWTEPDKRNV